MKEQELYGGHTDTVGKALQGEGGGHGHLFSQEGNNGTPHTHDKLYTREELEAALRSERRLLRESFRTFEKMVGHYQDKSIKPKMLQSRLHQDIEEWIFSMKEDYELRRRMDRMLNECRDGVLEKFYAQFPLSKGMSLERRQLARLIFLGYGTNAIAALMGWTNNVVKVRKSELKSLVSNSDAQDKDLFLFYFNK